MKTILLIIILSLLIVPTAQAAVRARPAPAEARYAMRTAVLPINSAFFIAIGRCEQPAPTDKRLPSGKWKRGYEWGINWHHPGPTYPGGLGVFAPLWTERGINGTKMAPSQDKATPAEQMTHAQMIVDKYGLYAWGCAGVALASTRYIDVSK
jgi:hypothetical protein